MKRRREFTRLTAALRTPPWTLPKVSVLLPVYNHAQTVIHAAESALDTQRYPVELVIVDDGSGPEVKTALEPLLGRPNVKYCYQENRGAAAAMNKAAQLAQGLFSTRIAADDAFKPGALDKMADFLMSNPAVGLTYANMELINASGDAVVDGSYRPHNHSLSAPSQLFLPIAADSLGFDSDNFVGICNLSRTALWRMAGNLNEKLLGTEDFEFALRLALLAELAHLDSDEMLYSYRLHSNSITSKLPAEKVSGEAAMLSTAFLRTRQLKQNLLSQHNLNDAAEVQSLAEKLGLQVRVALKMTQNRSAAQRLFVAEQS